ncbi:MAG: glutathione S-transferase family protein [Pararhodobacter sp.]
MIRLYGCYRSRATRPLWLAHELGLVLEHVSVVQAYRLADPAAPEAPLNTASPAFRALNPLGQIPLLVDGPLVLSESVAMTLYLARKAGGELGAQNLAEEGEILQWAFMAATGIEAPALDILRTLNDDTASDAARDRLAAASQLLARYFARIEGHLPGHEWLVGGRFTVADVVLADCVRYAQGHAPAFADFPLLSAWLARCQARPGWKAVVAGRNAEPA